MSIPPVIEEAISKCGEIDVQLSGLKGFLQEVKKPWWVANDPGYVKATEIYTTAKATLIAKVDELPDV